MQKQKNNYQKILPIANIIKTTPLSQERSRVVFLFAIFIPTRYPTINKIVPIKREKPITIIQKIISALYIAAPTPTAILSIDSATDKASVSPHGICLIVNFCGRTVLQNHCIILKSPIITRARTLMIIVIFGEITWLIAYPRNNDTPKKKLPIKLITKICKNGTRTLETPYAKLLARVSTETAPAKNKAVIIIPAISTMQKSPTFQYMEIDARMLKVYIYMFASVAQLVEQHIRNVRVGGSNPPRSSKLFLV